MLPFEPPPWNGEYVTLYHGALERSVTSILAGVDLRYAKAKKDLAVSIEQHAPWPSDQCRVV
jgi:hypothetical protein